jgi:integrase
MARPPLPLGTYGNIDYLTMPNGHVRARARFRDYDGTTRPVTRFAESRSKAERALKLAIRDRSGSASDDVTGDSRVSDLVALWLADVDGTDLASRTKEQYKYTTDRYIIPAIGDLRVREVSVSAADHLLKAVTQQNGPGAAKTTKSVLSNLLGLAVRRGALDANPIRDVGRISRQRKLVRSLTTEESVALLKALRADKTAIGLDLPDLVEFMLGTGVRIGEALAVRPSALTSDARVLEINATVIRIKGMGVQIQENPKTKAGWRAIAVPDYVAAIARRRLPMAAVTKAGVIFPSVFGHVRDSSNTSADLRRALDRADFKWVTSHTFRKTVATRLDDAGMTARQIADHLGHSQPSVTQDIYLGRKVASTRAADVLDALVFGS